MPSVKASRSITGNWVFPSVCVRDNRIAQSHTSEDGRPHVFDSALVHAAPKLVAHILVASGPRLFGDSVGKCMPEPQGKG